LRITLLQIDIIDIFYILIEMDGREDVNMIESFECKLDAIMNALNTLASRTTKIEGFFAKFHRDIRSRTF